MISQISSLSFFFLTLLQILPSVLAWGPAGHYFVAQLGFSLSNIDTQRKIVSLVGTDQFGDLSTWADAAARSKSKSYVWSKHLHYISGTGSPAVGTATAQPSKNKCGFDLAKDCKQGECVVGAIGNYTTRLLDCSLDQKERMEAFKFLIHFVGDVIQPLHTMDRDRGGNLISVKFAPVRRPTNLHSVWDSRILTKHIQQAYSGSNDLFMESAKKSILQTKNWSIEGCFSPHANKPFFEEKTPDLAFRCGLEWALESNQIACTTAYPTYDILQEKHVKAFYETVKPTYKGNMPRLNLAYAYYDQMRWQVENRIKLGAIRLANLLDRIFAHSSCKNATLLFKPSPSLPDASSMDVEMAGDDDDGAL